MKQYSDDVKELFSSKLFVIAILIVAVISYGFAATNISISIDDLQNDRYMGSGNDMLQAGRFGMNLTYLLRGGKWYNSYSTDIIAVIFLMWAAITFCVLFRRVSRNHISVNSCTVFSCMLISYPLMNEIWEYTGANTVVCVSFFLSSVVVLVMYEWLHSSKKQIWILTIAAAAMMWLCAGYESLVSVYIFCVFAVLTLQVMYGDEREKEFWVILRQGLVYAGILMAGIILRLIVHRMILAIMDLEPIINGSAQIYWFEYPVKNVLVNFVFQFILDYILYALVYFPITVFLISCVVFVIIGIILCSKYGKIILFPWLGMLFSLFILGLVWGDCPPYRTCQVFAIFVAFTAMLVISQIESHAHGNKVWIRSVSLAMALYLCLFQANYLNYFLTLNHLRSEEEAEVVRNVGLKLASEYDNGKPVAFVGDYELSDSILERASISEDSKAWKLYDKICEEYYRIFNRTYEPSRKIPITNINSVLEWSISVTNSQAQMQELFEYYGFSYVLADYFTYYPQAMKYAVENEMPIYPKEGYVVELEDYIIVRLGEEMYGYPMDLD